MNGFTFYNNYFRMIEYLPDEDRLKMYDAIMNYMFNNKKPKLDKLTAGLFLNIQMALDTSKNNSKRSMGKGAPIGNQNAVKKQTENKPKTNQKETKNKQIYISTFLFLFSNLYISNLDNKDKIYKLLEEYLEIRLKNKYIVNETIVNRLINKLNTYGKTDKEKIEIIENAINGAWKDFYELKNDKPKYQQVLEDWLNKPEEKASEEEIAELDELMKGI